MGAARPFAAYWVASFVAHLAWENAQMPLFEAAGSWRENFVMCLLATATGDMLFMLTLYLTLAVVHRDGFWVADRRSYAHPATWLLPVLVGVCSRSRLSFGRFTPSPAGGTTRCP